MRKVPNWHDHFFELVNVISKRSKDENTQVGAVIVGPGKEIVSTGYNSFPRGVEDDHKERQERPEKYFWFEHAERNAIYNAARTGVAWKGAVLYVPAMPCMDCARGIVQVGIKQVIINAEDQRKWAKKDKWIEHSKRTVRLFKEAGVELLVRERYFDVNEYFLLNFIYWENENEHDVTRLKAKN